MADETDAFPAEEEADSELESQEPAAKRKKSAPFMKKVDGIQSRLDAKVKKLSSTEALIDKMQDKQRNLALTKKEQSSLERWRSTSASLVTEVNTLRTELKEAQEEANAKKAAAEAAAAAAAEKKELEAEMKREYSEAGTFALINEKCKRDRNFDSNADNHDLVWQHVGEAVNKLTETGQLPASDRRNYKSHRAKYQQEYKFFKMWADKAQRAVEQSGVDMDELLEKVTDGQRPTTAIFLKWGYLMNVSVIPPYRINSDNAEGRGGCARSTPLSMPQLLLIPTTTRTLQMPCSKVNGQLSCSSAALLIHRSRRRGPRRGQSPSESSTQGAVEKTTYSGATILSP